MDKKKTFLLICGLVLLALVIFLTRLTRIYVGSVPYKISSKKVYFIPGPVYREPKDITLNFYKVFVMTTFSKKIFDHGVAVYDSIGLQGSGPYLLYYPQDKGIYVQSYEDYRGGRIIKYYYMGEGEIKEGIIKASFPKGTWFSYQKKQLLSPKDIDCLNINIPDELKEVPADYFK